MIDLSKCRDLNDVKVSPYILSVPSNNTVNISCGVARKFAEKGFKRIKVMLYESTKIVIIGSDDNVGNKILFSSTNRTKNICLHNRFIIDLVKAMHKNESVKFYGQLDDDNPDIIVFDLKKPIFY